MLRPRRWKGAQTERALGGGGDAASRRMARARPSAVAARTQARDDSDGRKEPEARTTGGEIISVTRLRVGTTTGESEADEGEESDGGSGMESITSRHHGAVAFTNRCRHPLAGTTGTVGEGERLLIGK